MNTFISKAAAVLLVPVILGTSCFSCLAQATPVSAATIPPPEMSVEQNKNCDGYRKPVVSPIRDGNMHAAHTTECSRTHNQTNFEAKQPQPTDIHHAMIGRVFHAEKIFLTRHQPQVRPPRFSQKNKHFLIGTTVKKE